MTDPYAFGLARLHEVVTNWREERVAVFSDRHAAVEWLKGHIRGNAAERPV